MAHLILRTLAVWAVVLVVLLYVHRDMHKATGGAAVVGVLWGLGERYFSRGRRQ